jgi:hypothetical protein
LKRFGTGEIDNIKGEVKMAKVQKFHVVVEASDGTHVIAKRLTHAKATERAMEWLGDCYDENGKDCWVGAYGGVIFLEPVKHKEARV